MSQVIKDTFSFTYKVAKFFISPKILVKRDGARFLKKSEYKKFINSSNTGLLLDGVNNRLSESDSFQNVCFTAKVGAGKTTKYIIPNVLDKANNNCSIAVHDPKGEVYSSTSGYLKSKGYNVVVFDITNPNNSHYFNPCLECKNEVEIEQIATTLVFAGNPNDKDPYWNNGAIRILSVLLKCLSFGKKKYFNLANLHYLIQNFGNMGESLDRWIIRNCWNPSYPEDPYILNEWKGALTGNKEAVQSFVGVALTVLKSMTNRDLRNFLSKSDYSLSYFRKEKTVIYFITPPENQQYYSFLTSLFFRSLFNECMRREHLSGRSLPVYILYDEFGNSYIPDFVSIANTVRGYGVSLSIILQSISQLQYRYGKLGADAIHGSINTHICLAGVDNYTAEFFSSIAGKIRETQSKSFTDHMTQYREYNLLNSSEVRTLTSDQVLIVSRNRQPVIMPIKAFFETSKLNFTKYKPFIVPMQGDFRLALVDIN